MLRRVPAQDLLRLTLKQPLVQIAPKGHCYISFRAGLLLRKDGKLTADKRKGQVAVVKTDQGFTAVQWFERISGESGGVDDFSLADEPEIEEVLPEFSSSFEWFNENKRVLKIVFKDETLAEASVQEPDRSMFFWLQEPEKDKDADLLLRCNKAIKGANWTPAGSSAAPAAASVAQPPAQPNSTTMSQQEVAQQLLRMLQQAQQGPGPEVFGDVLTPEVLEQLIRQDGVAERLMEFLPDSLKSSEELQRTPRSVQIWQQLGVLSHGIRSGQVNAQQFGVQPSRLGVIPFLEAVQQNVDSTRQSEKAAWTARKASAANGAAADVAMGDAGAETSAAACGTGGAAMANGAAQVAGGDTEMKTEGAEAPAAANGERDGEDKQGKGDAGAGDKMDES